MADYTQITNFTVKDGLAAGDPNKLIKGVDFDGEFAAISTSLSTKIDANDASGTGAAELPTGTTAQRPTPTTGMFRFNSENSAFEGYDGSNWGSVGGASGGGGNPFIYENDQNVTVDYTITAGKNGMSAGPITIDSGATVTVPSGSVWTIV